MSASSSKLFQPIQVGDIQLAHRVVFAPATRYRVDDTHTPVSLVAEYYEQRASVPGSLLISEATLVAQRAGGGQEYSRNLVRRADIRVESDRVHAKRSFIYLQIWALGRAVQADVLEKENITCVSASDIPLPGAPTPRPLTVDEIKEYAELFAQGASNAVHKAGSCTRGSNVRTDAYGGSIENRVRFALEVTEAVVKVVGQTKTAFRISPWGTWQEMHFDDPMPTYAHLVTELRDRYPNLAYLHVVEPRADGDQTASSVKEHHSNDFLREIWGSRPFISAGGYTRVSAIAVAEEKGNLVAFARPYIANPDLPYRLIHDIALTVGNRALYYALGSVDPKGYTDYPFASPVDSLSSKLASLVHLQ
ncbi:putative inactive dehydrogenase EasA [Mycena venus]|uniref:Putative inactive dehydrogenase EasA n=1 Tax=Mycena venus TaxID=2733690 RepID=A0A8H6YES0_9AGAR|nr:putative inactive dehydrogenase EasA [Mycena venus]